MKHKSCQFRCIDRVLSLLRAAFDMSCYCRASILAMVAFSFCAVIPLRSQDFAVQGTLTSSMYTPQGALLKSGTETFTVYVSGSKWLISEKVSGPTNWITCETGYDGTNMFKLVTTPPGMPSNRVAIITKRGSIIPGQIPPGHPSFATRSLWVAYASGGYFQSVTNSVIAGLWGSRTNRNFDDFGDFFPQVEASWTLSTSQSHLPRQVSYFGGVDAQSNNKAPDVQPGYLTTLYSATFTNVGSSEIPNQFSIVRFTQDLDATTNLSTFPVVTQEGVAELRTFSSPSFVPELTDSTLIFDYRLRPDNVEYVRRYVVTNGQWAAVSVAQLQHEYEAIKTRKNVKTAQIGRRRPIVIIVMSMFSAGVLFAVVRASSKSTAK